jgi:arsenate reductase
MTEVTLYHNPRCTKSRQALEIAEQRGPDDGFELSIVRYLDEPPTADELRAIVAKLEDEPSKLVRRDNWSALGVTAADVATADGVIDVLSRHPQLMERPVIVTADLAFIGRPTERVSDFFADKG